MSQITKNSKSSAFMPKFFTEEYKIKHGNSDVMSKTPTKFPVDKKYDVSLKGSKTPVKYKNVFENGNTNNTNKTSNISNGNKT